VILYWYPAAGEDANESPVWKRLKKDLSKHKELMLLVETFLDTVRRNGSLDLMLKSEQIGQLGDGLYEMRIPKSKRGGVVRIYFCYSESNRQELILLDSELKHETAPSKLKIARKRLRELKSAN